MYYIVNYKLHDQYMEKRAAHRSAHFDLIKEYIATGEFLMGGAYDDEKDAVLLFNVDDIERINSFIKVDPYVLNGVATSYSIRKWNMVTGDIKHTSLLE